MTMAAQEPVISGQWYTVTEVDGRPQAGLDSCVGERQLTLGPPISGARSTPLR